MGVMHSKWPELYSNPNQPTAGRTLSLDTRYTLVLHSAAGASLCLYALNQTFLLYVAPKHRIRFIIYHNALLSTTPTGSSGRLYFSSRGNVLAVETCCT